MRRKAVRNVWASGVVAAGLACAAPAMSQVLEIQPDGGVVTYSGPAVYSDDGVRSLVAQPAPAAAAPAEVAPIEVARAIRESAQRHAVSAPLVEAVAWQESRFRQQAVSPKGAMGVMQLMPQTARRLGVDPADLKANVDGGVAYLGQMIARFGDTPRALAAYNAGPEAVERFGGVPPFAETRAYVRSILGRLGAAASIATAAE
jgi:soluble lytic murein transglycosylase-like protein